MEFFINKRFIFKFCISSSRNEEFHDEEFLERKRRPFRQKIWQFVIDDIDQAFIREKNKVVRNERRKNYIGFHILKLWQILMRFARALS